MIKFLVIDNSFAVPLDRVDHFESRVCKDAPYDHYTVVTTDEGTGEERNLNIAMPFEEFLRSLHGFQRAQDATFSKFETIEHRERKDA